MVVAEEPRLRARLVPGIRALGLEGLQHARVDARIAQQEIGSLAAAPFFTKQVSGTPQAR
jgi:hypothetical protein